jgi:hypothetical protein
VADLGQKEQHQAKAPEPTLTQAKQPPVAVAAKPEAKPPAATVAPVADLRQKEQPQAKAPEPTLTQAKQPPVAVAAKPEAKPPAAPVAPVAATALREKDSTPTAASAPRPQPLPKTAKKAAAKLAKKTLAKQAKAPVNAAKLAKKTLAKQAKAPVNTAPKARSKVAKKALPKSDKAYVTLAEYLGNAIEIRNGNGVRGLAFDTRTRLAREGFQVARIGNYRDFGMEQTVIFYRPGAEKVAEAVNAKCFKTARLEATEWLPGDVNLKIILGRDLLVMPQILAQLSYKWGN